LTSAGDWMLPTCQDSTTTAAAHMQHVSVECVHLACVFSKATPPTALSFEPNNDTYLLAVDLCDQLALVV
jgi:hypothetical protein